MLCIRACQEHVVAIALARYAVMVGHGLVSEVQCLRSHVLAVAYVEHVKAVIAHA